MARLEDAKEELTEDGPMASVTPLETHPFFKPDRRRARENRIRELRGR